MPDDPDDFGPLYDPDYDSQESGEWNWPLFVMIGALIAFAILCGLNPRP